LASKLAGRIPQSQSAAQSQQLVVWGEFASFRREVGAGGHPINVSIILDALQIRFSVSRTGTTGNEGPEG
jgi:hypothetical protein